MLNKSISKHEASVLVWNSYYFFFFSNVTHRIYYWSQADSEEIRNIRSQALQK